MRYLEWRMRCAFLSPLHTRQGDSGNSGSMWSNAFICPTTIQQKNECRQWDVASCSILAFMYCRQTSARLFRHLTPLCPSHWYSREQSLSERSAMAKTVQGCQHLNQGLHNGQFRHAERPVRARETVRLALRNEPFGHAERTVWQAKTDGSAGARKGERKGEQAMGKGRRAAVRILSPR